MLRGLVYLRSITILAFLSLATASASAQLFEENFDQRDGPGPIENWTVFSEHWRVVNRTLHGLTGRIIPGWNGDDIGGHSAWSWAGNPPIQFPTTCELSFDMEFLLQGGHVGRHGGVMFCADSPTRRSTTNNNGYDLDWIDRESDHGLRLIRYDNGRDTLIGRGASTLRDPPSQWRIIIATETIEVWGDGQLLMEVQDETYRGGFLGFWAHGSNQFVMFDNIRVDNFSNPCEDCEKRAVGPGDERTGVLGSSGCTEQFDDQPIELFSLTVEDIFEGTLSVTSGEFAPSLGFYNDFCDLIALNSNCPDPDTQACFGINLGPGTYTIGVSGQPGDSGGAFTINVSGGLQGDPIRFVRGDSNSDGSINLSDGVTPLLYLFSGGDAPACMVAADANDTGGIEIADVILIFNWLFQGGRTPAPPSPSSAGYLATDCGADLGEAALGCERTALPCQ